MTQPKTFWMVQGPYGGATVRHINREEAENEANRLAAKNPSATSRFSGVHWHKAAKKWVACIGLDNRTIHIGTFADEVEAAKAYDRKAKDLHGKFAVLNFPGGADLACELVRLDVADDWPKYSNGAYAGCGE